MSFTPRGVIVPMVTPLTEAGEMNEAALRRLINHLLAQGVHGVFAAGTTGEFYALTLAQMRRLFQVTVEETAGRAPVFAGASAITTAQAVELTQVAEEAGVDAVSVLTPMFISPSDEQLHEHYTAIAAATRLPIIIYNNAPKTGVNVSAELARRLAAVDNIVGIKDSSGDFTLGAEYLRRTQDADFAVLAGRDTLIHAFLCHGGAGAVAACANVAPRLVADIYDKYIRGDIQGSLQAQFRLAPLRLAFGLGTFPAVIKEGLALLGLDIGHCAPPVGPLTAAERDQLKRVLTDMGLIAHASP